MQFGKLISIMLYNIHGSYRLLNLYIALLFLWHPDIVEVVMAPWYAKIGVTRSFIKTKSLINTCISVATSSDDSCNIIWNRHRIRNGSLSLRWFDRGRVIGSDFPLIICIYISISRGSFITLTKLSHDD